MNLHRLLSRKSADVPRSIDRTRVTNLQRLMVQTLTLHEEKNLARGVPHPLVSTAVIVRSSGTAPSARNHHLADFSLMHLWLQKHYSPVCWEGARVSARMLCSAGKLSAALGVAASALPQQADTLAHVALLAGLPPMSSLDLKDNVALGLLLVIVSVQSQLGRINVIATSRSQFGLAAPPGAGVHTSLALQCFILFAWRAVSFRYSALLTRSPCLS
jgi:hypothetical protein